MFTLYSSPGCFKCKLTVTALEKAGHTVNVIDVTVTDGALEEALALSGGRRELPIVKPPTGEPWSDFRADRIREYGA